MFVPLQRMISYLKPLDLEKLKERNKRAAGRFGYLDRQNTEYDQYYIVYVLRFPFTLYDITWPGLVSCFHLMLGVTFISQALIQLCLICLFIKIAKDILHFTEGQNTLDEHAVGENEVEEVEHDIPERDINNALLIILIMWKKVKGNFHGHL
ncbi:AVN_HP_G0119910.mRNA.1.CDS.1 [Saccharomyces cerevisiae]|nr:AVN_HP_G0119910.mRNA.1.CDS.1 [Saccharomyces cerevisiae]CAI6997015.1 AVN_HP_G0119910.mRNA.1.CDS.1 [Saccharomyces cerevisiae]